MRISAIVLAAGEGRRMGSKTPKALLPLGGRPLLLHSIAVFAQAKGVSEVILVLPAGRVAAVWRKLGPALARAGVTKVVAGGVRRQDSVLRGLAASDAESDVVLVHDSARPFVSTAMIDRVAAAAWKNGAAIPAVRTRDTIKKVGKGDRVVETPDRSVLWSAQTPQGFRRRVLALAYAGGHGKEDATDDAQIVERAGGTVVVVEGESSNFKITSREDLNVAEYMLTRLRRGRRSRTL